MRILVDVLMWFPLLLTFQGILLLVEQKSKTRYQIKISVMRVHCPTLRLQVLWFQHLFLSEICELLKPLNIQISKCIAI
jgi:hypothetical protein